MKYAQRFALLAAAAVGLVLAGAANAADKPASAPKKVLLVTHSGGFIHSSVVEAEKVLNQAPPNLALVQVTFLIAYRHALHKEWAAAASNFAAIVSVVPTERPILALGADFLEQNLP